ncbi:DUF3047 domain-containing protein [Methylonatrum kenyense]|uniref:DUF3047 domain-containing protein n=1 Tax=Methylonatrum kenyense TaxID=455253 RepID=UPI0020BF731B|nr:DUF3047 domain-containing protein [Methylonatrum kenyense]MCK8515616.1 DUF3047 domain-containing protein [Methylonatrum kenyense]
MRILSVPLLCLLMAPLAMALEFSPQDIMRQWDRHSFEGETRYELVDLDGRTAIHAVCDQASASGLFYREDIDLRETPVMEWRWRVDNTFDDIDETTRAGDDYPARIYVVDEHRVLRWRTRALNYVWSSTQEAGSDWENAYASQARMVASRGPEHAGDGWQIERRHIRDDFERLHGRSPERINAIAIMTDCDDTGQTAEAWYGGIRFLPED